MYFFMVGGQRNGGLAGRLNFVFEFTGDVVD
jgi:hypothetical protein